MEGIYRGDARGQPFDALSHIACRVRVSTAEHSAPIYGQMAALAVELIPGSRPLRFAGVGHCVAQESAAVLLEALEAEQHAALVARIRGHDNYFAVNGNLASVRILRHRVVRHWYKWLNRRGSRNPLTWKRFGERLLGDLQLPKARIHVQMWATV
jgi:hypothetical protein